MAMFEESSVNDMQTSLLPVLRVVYPFASEQCHFVIPIHYQLSHRILDVLVSVCAVEKTEILADMFVLFLKKN